MTKNQIWTGIISATAIGLFILYSRTVRNEYTEIKENGIELVGEVTVYGSDIFIICKNGTIEKSKRMSKPYSTIYDHETFRVYYLQKYPDKFYIDFKKPVYDRSAFEQTDCLEIKDTGDYIRFKYKVNDKEFERYCESDLEVKDLTLDKYKIDYKMDDPRVSYLRVE
jgi:hypothetical protein